MPDLPALSPRPDVLEFLGARRSRPAKTLTTPVPSKAEVEAMLTVAARAPDHGKLEPWRFIVLERDACLRLAALTEDLGPGLGLEPEKIAKSTASFANAHLVVTVVASPKPSAKIPEVEQTLSAGAVCQNLLTVALAAGWGANWLSDWMSRDRDFLTRGLALADHEWVAGYMHLGTETNIPPERPRPDLSAITQWVAT